MLLKLSSVAVLQGSVLSPRNRKKKQEIANFLQNKFSNRHSFFDEVSATL
jgi:hypothetical protein